MARVVSGSFPVSTDREPAAFFQGRAWPGRKMENESNLGNFFPRDAAAQPGVPPGTPPSGLPGAHVS